MKFRCLLAGAALWAACVGAAFAQGYRVINVMPDYWAFDEQAQGVDAETRLRLFHQLVIDRHPQVYAAAVIGLPEDKPYDTELARRFVRVERLVSDKTQLMRQISDSIAQDLPRYEARFREVFPDLDFRGDIYFMHSLGGFDGGTRKVAGRTALLFGVDMIAYVYGHDIDPQPFFHHELFHLYHQQFRGNGSHSGTFMGALWREGLATYVAHALNPQAVGVSVFGLPRTTPARTQADLPRLASTMRSLLDSRDRKDYVRYFMGARENADVPARSGYYVGYLVASKLAKKYSLRELARLPFDKVKPEIERALIEMEAGS